MVESPRPRLRFSLGQLIKLVIYCAVIFGCLSPAIRPRGYGMDRGDVIFVLGFEAIALPLALTACTLVLVRPSPARSKSVTILSLISTAAALGYALFVTWLLVESQRDAMRSPRVVPPSLLAWGVVALLDLALGAAFILLSSRLVRLLRAGR